MLFRFSVLLCLVLFSGNLLGGEILPRQSAPAATCPSSDEEEYREAVRDAFREAQRVTPWLIAPIIIVGIGALLAIYLSRRNPKIITKEVIEVKFKVKERKRPTS